MMNSKKLPPPWGSAAAIADQPMSVTGRMPFSGPLAATLGDPDAGRSMGLPSGALALGGGSPSQGALGATAHPSLWGAMMAGSPGGCAPPAGWPLYVTTAAAMVLVDGLGVGRDAVGSAP